MIVLKNKIRTRTTRHFGAWKGSEKALKIFHSKVNKTYAMKVDYNLRHEGETPSSNFITKIKLINTSVILAMWIRLFKRRPNAPHSHSPAQLGPKWKTLLLVGALLPYWVDASLTGKGGREEPTAVGDARLSDEAKKRLRFRVTSRPNFDSKVFLFMPLSILIDIFLVKLCIKQYGRIMFFSHR